MSKLHLHVGLPPGRLRRTCALDGRAPQRARLDSRIIHGSVSRRDSTVYFAPGSGCPSVIKVAAGIPVPKQNDDRVQSPSAPSADATVVIAGEVLVQTAYHLLGKPGRLLSLLEPSGIRRYLAWIDEYCQTHYLHFYQEDQQIKSASRVPQEEQDGEGESQYKSSRSEQGQKEEKSSVQQQRRHPTWPSMAGKKRSLKSEDSSDDEEEKRPRKMNQQSEKTLRYACPFYKHNPEEFVDERSCRGPGWPTVQRVKEHVLRKHKAPDHQCPRCLKEFKDDQLLMQHFRAEETCEVRQSPSPSSQLDGNKTRLLKQRSKTTATEDQKWYSLYRIIFPDDESLPNPYYKHEANEPASPALPSRDVALKMFQDNLNAALSNRSIGGKFSEWALHNPQMMDVVISGALSAFDDTFAVICGQRTSPCLDDELPPIDGPVLKDEAPRELEVPLVADFGATGQAPSQTEEVIEPTPDEVSNHALQYDLTTAMNMAQPPETGLYSCQQQQTQQLYQGGSVSQPECFNICPIARIQTPLSVDLMGIRGGIVDANLVNQYAVGNRLGTEGLPRTDAQSLGPAQKGYSYDQQELFTTKHDEFEEWLQPQYQNELDISEKAHDMMLHYI